jgi:hypothetical protein
MYSANQRRPRRAVRGVAQPIYVTGAIGGVTYRASGRRQIRELMDCRMANRMDRSPAPSLQWLTA